MLQIEAYESTLSTDDNTKRITDLETELQIAGSEMTRLQAALDDVEVWKEKLMKESKKAGNIIPTFFGFV